MSEYTTTRLRYLTDVANAASRLSWALTKGQEKMPQRPFSPYEQSFLKEMREALTRAGMAS